MRNLLNLTAAALTALLVQACGTSSTSNNNDAGATVQHVLLISVDGMHEQDMALCISNNTCPHIAALANTGVRFDTAFTPHMSDSFPGLAALITGGSPKSTGLFYDVSYDRNLYAPTDTTCSGGQGWNVVFDETTGLDGFDGGALVHLNGGGGFNPQAIPHEKDGGNCVPVYPHNYIRTNTIFEVVKANVPGARTAWADKHAYGYDWVNGPSGTGVDDLARTEINSTVPGKSSDWTGVYTDTETFDGYHVQIILNQIDGKDSSGNPATVPTLFGTNFQTLSVAEKANNAKDPTNPAGGGYTDANFTPGVDVAAAIAFVDTSIGSFVSELQAKNLLDSTLIVVTAKHGQSPADYSKLVKNGDTLTALLEANNYLDPNGNFGQYATVTGSLNDGSGLVGTGIVQTDDVGLIWLKDQSQTAAAVATLQANLGCADGGICANNSDGTAYILSGQSMIDTFGDPADGRTPDIFVQPNPGVIYSGSKKKDQEHGGFSADDSHVALLVSLPSLPKQTVTTKVSTTQVAATILKALGLDPSLLQSVKAENTAVLPNLPF